MRHNMVTERVNNPPHLALGATYLVRPSARKARQMLGTAFLLFINATAVGTELTVPKEVRPFIEKGTKVLALHGGDLNGDGRTDYLLVLERPEPVNFDIPWEQRPLIVLARGADGHLQEVARNEKVVYCSDCGGVFGDPFDGITLEGKAFTVRLYGGSRFRWSYDYKFSYSRRDQTWQLVSVREVTTDTRGGDGADENAEPKTEAHEYRPPKDFGKINLKDFDPEKWLGQGAR